MNAIISTEMRFVRDSNTGQVYTGTAQSYSFWRRYLAIFDRVHVLARVQHDSAIQSKALRADGPAIEFIDLPYYLGPSGYLKSRQKIRQIMAEAIAGPEAVILRVPSQIGTVAAKLLEKAKKPFGIEVVGDPWDSFRPEASGHPLGSLFRIWFTLNLRKQCRSAACTSYVTEAALQRRFPPAPGRFTVSYSSIELGPEAFVERARPARTDKRCKTVVTVASLEQRYKGIDLLLEATADCVQRGLDLAVVIVGGGRLKDELEALGDTLGLSDRVTFTGPVPSGQAVRDYLDSADLFVLPSRSEGLPRVVIEAMARGLPCVATRVGGIPELLDEDALVEPCSSKLAACIRRFLSDAGRMHEASIRNLSKAHEYAETVLSCRRQAFYTAVAKATSTSMASREPASIWVS